MRKLRFLFVLLAMVSLASCNYEEEAIRYEVTSENPNECYVAEIVPGYVSSNPNEFFFEHNKKAKVDRLVISGSRNAILTSMTWPSGLLDYKNVCYDIPLSDELISWVIKFPKKRNKPSNDELKKICNDFIKNAGFSIDTLYKPSYRLIISDIERFKKESNATKTMQYVYSGGIFSQAIYTKKNLVTVNLAPYKEGVIQDVNLLALGLRDFHHIPTLNEVDSIYANDKVFFKPEFYSGQKSVKEVNEMLSEYGLSLEPTGEMMQVATYRSEPFVEPYAFKSKKYTIYFCNIILLSILLGIYIIFIDYIPAYYYDLLPKNENIRERLKYAVPFWVIAMAFAVFFVMLISNIENYSFDVEPWILISIYFTIILSTCGIYVLRHRKSNTRKNERIISYIVDILSLILLGLTFCIDKDYYGSGFEISIIIGIVLIVGGSFAYFLNKKKKKEQNNEN